MEDFLQMSNQSEKIVPFKGKGENSNIKPGTPTEDTLNARYNGNGGGGDMNDKDFVTHKEFDNAMYNIDKHFDHIDTKFAEQTLGLYKAIVSVGLGVVAILGFLITLVTFLK